MWVGVDRALADPLIAAHGGQIVGTARKGLLADFSDVVDWVSLRRRGSTYLPRDQMLNGLKKSGSAEASALFALRPRRTIATWRRP